MSERHSREKIHTVYFDLDNTLYHKNSGITDSVTMRIIDYMIYELKITREEAVQLRGKYYKQFGMSLRGLMLYHNVDPLHLFDYIHGGLNIEEIIRPNPELRKLLLQMKGGIKKWVFSNADMTHCLRVIKALQIEGIFDGVFDVLKMIETFKPHPNSYELILAHTGSSDFSGCIFLDDTLANLIAAKEKGMITVLVGGSPTDAQTVHTHVDYHIENILEMRKIFPELFEDSNTL